MRCLHQVEEVGGEEFRRARRSFGAHRAGMTRAHVQLTLDGMVAVHAVRAVWTSLTAVAGVMSADVTMAGVRLDVDGSLTDATIRRSLDEALAAADVRIVTCTISRSRALPIV